MSVPSYIYSLINTYKFTKFLHELRLARGPPHEWELLLYSCFRGKMELSNFWNPDELSLSRVTCHITSCCCSVSKSRLTLCDPTDYSIPGFPVLHYLRGFAQTHVRWVSDAIQSSHQYITSYSLRIPGYLLTWGLDSTFLFFKFIYFNWRIIAL